MKTNSVTGTKLRSLTSNLWQQSPVKFQLEDGTELILRCAEVTQEWKESEEKVKVPSKPPVLVFTLSVPPVTIHSEHGSMTIEVQEDTESKAFFDGFFDGTYPNPNREVRIKDKGTSNQGDTT